MFCIDIDKKIPKPQFYHEVRLLIQGILDGEQDVLAGLSNTASILFHLLEDINWVGFYRFSKKRNQLVLATFQGKPACFFIPYGKGVCGKAWLDKKSCVVDDVHQFSGHIACDVETRSEIVIPMMVGGQVGAVLDIDSPIGYRFDQEDQKGLENIVAFIENHVDHKNLFWAL